MSRIRSKSLAIRKRRISTNRAILFRLSGRIPFFPRFSHHPAQPSSFEETLYTTTVRSDCRAKLASALIASKQAAFQPFPDKSGHGSDLRRFCRGAASQEQDTGRSKQSARDLANHPETPGYRGGPDIPKASKIVRSCLKFLAILKRLDFQGGFRILFARRGLFRVLVERCSMIAWSRRNQSKL